MATATGRISPASTHRLIGERGGDVDNPQSRKSNPQPNPNPRTLRKCRIWTTVDVASSFREHLGESNARSLRMDIVAGKAYVLDTDSLKNKSITIDLTIANPIENTDLNRTAKRGGKY